MVRLFWTAFLWVAAAWNVSGSLQMLLIPETFTGGSEESLVRFFLLLCAVLLAVLGAATAFIAMDPRRYWPLCWLAAAGRMTAGAIMLGYWARGEAPDRILTASLVDLGAGVLFLVLALWCWRKGAGSIFPAGAARSQAVH